uniref:Fatty acid-binding protein, liver n=1 Tax=Callorhinchus milii TaxID=7868 RepID=K4FSC3_CALMI|nr:fatty acid-binding protein 1-like protein [Callorhinchus milii]
MGISIKEKYSLVCYLSLLHCTDQTFIVMAFNGKYELENQDNFGPFMKALGLSDEMIEKGNDLKSVSEIVQNGNHFKITVTTGTKVLTNEFIVGQETDVQTPTGAKMKAIINLEGTNKLVLKAENVTSITELTGDRLVNTMTIGNIVYKRQSKKIC